MQQLLTDKLRAYLINNNPEVVLKLQGDTQITTYIRDKVEAVMPLALRLIEEERPGYAIEELCMNEMTADLRPSRFHYLQQILQDEFNDSYQKFREAGVLTYETVNLLEQCNTVMDDHGFSEENEDDRFLRYAIIAEVHDYLLG